MNLEEFKKLNPKDPGSWPWTPKLMLLAGILLVILVIGFFLDWKSQWNDLDNAQNEEVRLKQTFLAKKKEAVNLDFYKRQLSEIEKSFGALLKQLPNRSEMEALLVDINQAGLGRGLQFDLFRPAPKETVTEYYAELPISIKVTGSYHDIGAFASDLAQLPRIVTLEDINIAPGKNGLLTMNAVVSTYRYPDASDKPKAGKKK
ncbi:MAG TPA: type 4a pilus biogenesis protein PilO [Burkholderiales bacterium]|nr:type 4a pilus biogenesis protein PilO [Burkholderiales bacterium]